MQTLEQAAPHVEVYSIDEAFLDISGLEHTVDLQEFAHEIRTRIKREIGLPVCVGIAPSKTLAKLANQTAKDTPGSGGVVRLCAAQQRQTVLQDTTVDRLWGIGSRLTRKLNQLGIYTAADLAAVPAHQLRTYFSVEVARTATELRCQPCYSLNCSPEKKQQIICSRSFGRPIGDYQEMRRAVANYCARAAERVREQGQQAGTINLFLRTNIHRPEQPQHTPSATMKLPYPSADSRQLSRAAGILLRRAWRNGHAYVKAGIMLGDLQEHGQQPDLFAEKHNAQTSQALMATVDAINSRYQGAIQLGLQGARNANWQMRREMMSPAYTTRWEEIPRAV
jgi:DNA polymerase V